MYDHSDPRGVRGEQRTVTGPEMIRAPMVATRDPARGSRLARASRWLGVGLAICLTAGPVAAAHVSLHDRGPCPNAADGVCIPNRRNFGYYGPKWRPWPGDRPGTPTATGPEKPTPVPSVVKPYELPPPEREEDFGRAGPLNLGPGSGPAPSGPPADGDQGDRPPMPPADSEDAPPSLPGLLRNGAHPHGPPAAARPTGQPVVPPPGAGARTHHDRESLHGSAAEARSLPTTDAAGWRPVAPLPQVRIGQRDTAIGRFEPRRVTHAETNQHANPLRHPPVVAQRAVSAVHRASFTQASRPSERPRTSSPIHLRVNPLRPR